jgi:hypothetical protein
MVYHFSEFFSSLEKWDLFRRDKHRITRFGIPPLPWVPLAGPKAPKTPEFHFVPLTKGFGNAIQEDIDYGFSLLFGQMNLFSHPLDQLCLCHATSSPEWGRVE